MLTKFGTHGTLVLASIMAFSAVMGSAEARSNLVIVDGGSGTVIYDDGKNDRICVLRQGKMVCRDKDGKDIIKY